MPNQTMDVSARTLVYGHSSLLGMMDTSGQRKTLNSLNNVRNKNRFYSLNKTIYLNRKPQLKKQVEKQTASLVAKMARCQYESVRHYTKEYWEKAARLEE